MFIYSAWVFMGLFCSAPELPLHGPGPQSLGSIPGVIWAVQTRVAERPFSASRQAGSSKQQRFISLKVRKDLQSIRSIAI